MDLSFGTVTKTDDNVTEMSDSEITGVDQDYQDSDGDYNEEENDEDDSDSDSDEDEEEENKPPSPILHDLQEDMDNEDENEYENNEYDQDSIGENINVDSDDKYQDTFDNTYKELENDLNQAKEEYEQLYEGDNEYESEYVPEEDTEIETVTVTEEIQEQAKNDDVNRTRSGRVSNKRSYLDYTPDFSNKAYSSNVTVGDETKMGMIFAQYIEKNFGQFFLHEGLKKFGDKGSNAAFEELKQLHQRDAFKPRFADSMSNEEKKKALNTIVLIEEKCDGRIKGRAVADGRKQRTEIQKEDAASPTASLESIILTSIIDAVEGREVCIADIPNAFVQTDMDGDTVFMKLTGAAADLLVKTAPELYRKYIILEKGKRVLYVEAQKAIYGTLRAALLFYKQLVKDLKSIFLG